MAEEIVRAERLTKEFRGQKALDGIDFSVQKGCLTAVIGPDGAGKTTLMRLLAGLLLPDGGSLSVLGLELPQNAQGVQNQLSYMPQKFGLYEDLSILENMELYANLHGVPKEMRKERFRHLLEMMGLYEFRERRAGKLSGGMKQKLALACTLVRSPKLLLLDEPTVGVDPLSRRELWEVLRQLVREESLSVLINTAYMEEAELCQRVYVLDRGRLLFHGMPTELKALAEGRAYYAFCKKQVPVRILQSFLLDDKAHVVDAVPEGGRVRLLLQKDVEEAYFSEKCGISLEKASARLEDGFMLLLRAQHRTAAGFSYAPVSLENFRKASLASETEIEVRELLRRFGDFTAVAKTSFQVHRGEVFGLLGPNGAGKTTTFRMLCGLLPMTSGFLRVAGVNLRTARTEARKNIGYVAQKFSLYGNLSALENLAFFGGVYGLSGKELKQRIHEVMVEFNLMGMEQLPSMTLPEGYRRRLSMAAALLHRPKILFLDEPTSGIDPVARREFWREITALSELGTTIVITTHFMEEAEYCDRMMIQDHGRLLAIGSPKEIREKYGSENSSMNDIFISVVEKAREKQEGGNG